MKTRKDKINAQSIEILWSIIYYILSNRRPALKEKPIMRKVSAKRFICMLIGFDSILLVINCVKSKNKIHKAPSASLSKTRVFICYVLL